MTKKKRGYSEEFKQNAVRIAQEIGIQEAANSLAVSKASISIWKNKYSPDQPDPTKEIDWEKEAKRLQKENSYLKQINDVLKKSTAIFSQDNLPGSK